MKKTKNTVLLLVTLSFFLFCSALSAAADTGPDSSGAVPGIEAKITGTFFELNDADERVISTTDCEFVNHNKKTLQRIDYVLYFWNEKGGLIYKKACTFDAAEMPVGYEETADDTQTVAFDSPSEPAFTSVEVLSVLMDAESAAERVPEQGDYLYLSMNDPSLETIAEYPPEIIRVWLDVSGSRREADITYPLMIQRAVQDFMKIRVGEEINEIITDNYNGFSLIFADGHEAVFDLNGWNLEFRIGDELHIFELEEFDDFHWILVSAVHPLE